MTAVDEVSGGGGRGRDGGGAERRGRPERYRMRLRRAAAESPGGHPPSDGAVPPDAATAPPPGGHPPDAVAELPRHPLDAAADEARRRVRGHRPPPLRWDVVDAAVLSAGLVDALAARRARALLTRPAGRVPAQPDADAAGIEVAARLGADAAGTLLADRALRWLAAVLAAGGRPPLRLLAVRLTAGAVELMPDGERTDLPAPFEAADGGRRWTLPRTVGPPEPVAGPGPAPALVSLGGDGVGRVLVDLAACRGVVCVAGDRNAVRSVVAAAAVELVTAPWADGSVVTLVGFGDQLAPLGGSRLRCADTLGEVVDEVTDRLSAARRAGRPGPTEVVVLAAPPAPEDLADLTGWFAPAPERSPLAVLVAGDVPGAGWRFELDRSGVLDTGPLRHPVGAQAVSARTFAALGRLVQADGEDEPAAAVVLPRPVDLGAVRVLVQLFGGPPAARGDVGAGADLAVEITAYAALHDTVPLPELAAAVWPRGVADSVRNDAVRRTQWWLGLDAAGRPRLALRDGVLRLSPEVQTDWAVFVALTDRGDAVGAAGLLAGEPLTRHPDGRYAWLAREPLARRVAALVADRCAGAAGRALAAGDPAGAAAVARAGLHAVPYAGLLWDRLEEAGTDDAARAEVRRARAARAAGVRP